MLDGGKTKEQLLEELSRMQKEIEERVEEQERFIEHFRLLVQNDGLFSQVIDNLPYPVAIFQRSGVVCMANKVLMSEAGIGADDIPAGKINLFDRVTDENYTVLDAAEDVFLGETTVLGGLVSPLALFCRDDTRTVPDDYRRAVFFPVVGCGGRISHGAVTLMK